MTDSGRARLHERLRFVGRAQIRTGEAPRPDALPTPGQLKGIAHLWSDLAEYLPGARYASFQRVVPSLGPQTRRQANAAIEALKQRVQREMRRAVMES